MAVHLRDLQTSDVQGKAGPDMGHTSGEEEGQGQAALPSAPNTHGHVPQHYHPPAEMSTDRGEVSYFEHNTRRSAWSTQPSSRGLRALVWGSPYHCL